MAVYNEQDWVPQWEVNHCKSLSKILWNTSQNLDLSWYSTILRHKSLDGKLNNPARLYLVTGHFTKSVFPNFSSLPSFSTVFHGLAVSNKHEHTLWVTILELLLHGVYKMGKEPIWECLKQGPKHRALKQSQESQNSEGATVIRAIA